MLTLLFIGSIKTPDIAYKNDPQYLQTPIKALWDWRFVLGITRHNLSLCDTFKKNKASFDARNCLWDFVKSIHIEPPYIFIYIIYAQQEKINPAFFDVGPTEIAEMSFWIFWQEDRVKIHSYNAIPNYIKINYENGERWIYGERDLKNLSKYDSQLFEGLTKNPRLILDGKEYSNWPYDKSDQYRGFNTYWASKDANDISKSALLEK